LSGSVIQVRDNQNVIIEKCALNGSGIIGVTAYNTQNLSVVGNYIYNNSEYGILFDLETNIEIKNNQFEKNGKNGNDHVVKALNAFLSEVEPIQQGMNKSGVKMANNKFK
jgi:parallel beta-helix repeat protein